MANLNLPHTYHLKSSAINGESYIISAENVDDIETAPPKNFGGPGNIWSPENLFVGTVVDCFMMTFRAISGMSKLEWNNLDCTADGILDRIDGVIQFTEITINATLRAPIGTNEERAIRVMEKSEKNCLVSNSIKPKVHLNARVEIT